MGNQRRQESIRGIEIRGARASTISTAVSYWDYGTVSKCKMSPRKGKEPLLAENPNFESGNPTPPANPADHNVLGSLTWDERLQWWISEVDLLPNHPIEIFISPESGTPDDPEAFLASVRFGLERIRHNYDHYRHWTAVQLMDRRWDQEEPMTVQEISDILRLASIDFHPDGGAGLYWDDQDRFFGGHNLITEVDKDGQCLELRMEG